MSTIKRRVANLERRRQPENTVPEFGIRTDHGVPFVAGYDAKGVFHFTIQIDRATDTGTRTEETGPVRDGGGD